MNFHKKEQIVLIISNEDANIIPVKYGLSRLTKH